MRSSNRTSKALSQYPFTNGKGAARAVIVTGVSIAGKIPARVLNRLITHLEGKVTS